MSTNHRPNHIQELLARIENGYTDYPMAIVRSVMLKDIRAILALLNDAEKDIDGFWLALERSWEIEKREYFEAEARTNGFGSPLAMAVHHMWKRDAKPQWVPEPKLGPQEEETEEQIAERARVVKEVVDAATKAIEEEKDRQRSTRPLQAQEEEATYQRGFTDTNVGDD